MADFTIYNPETGQILGTGYCPDSEVSAQLAAYPGADVLQERSDIAMQYVSGGVLVNKPAQPTPDYVWDHETLTWVQAAPVVPASVSRFQARAALHIAGLLPSIEAALAAADPLAQLAWADAQVFRRDSPTIAALAAAIGLTEAQIDDLFIQAAQIQA